jgi:hypothetical protein
MTNSESEPTAEPTEGIADEQLPEDLRPTEDNPLAQPLSEDEAPDDPTELDMHGGTDAGQGDDEELED